MGKKAKEKQARRERRNARPIFVDEIDLKPQPKTKTIRYFDSWIKIRNDILIAYCEPYNNDKACKIYHRIKDGKIYALKTKYL